MQHILGSTNRSDKFDRNRQVVQWGATLIEAERRRQMQIQEEASDRYAQQQHDIGLRRDQEIEDAKRRIRAEIVEINRILAEQKRVETARDAELPQNTYLFFNRPDTALSNGHCPSGSLAPEHTRAQKHLQLPSLGLYGLTPPKNAMGSKRSDEGSRQSTFPPLRPYVGNRQ